MHEAMRGCRSAARVAIPGQCRHCDWRYVGSGYPETVEAYHDHLRESHPDAWVRA